MPFRYPPAVRTTLLARIAGGERLKHICREAGMPCHESVTGWMRRDPEFAAAVAAAREEGHWRRRVRFDEDVARALIRRLEPADRPLVDVLRDPDMPGYRTFCAWRRGDAWFAEEVRRVLAPKAESKAARLRARYRPFDPAVADRLYVRLWQGEALRAVLRSDRAFPSLAVLARWRREEPELDAILRSVFKGWKRRRPQARTLCTHEMTEAVCEGLVAGGSLRSVSREEGMPSQGALYGWMRRYPAFAAAVRQAGDDREDVFLEAMLQEADAATKATLRQAQRRVAQLQGRMARLRARPPGGGNT